ncbi:hypothetical protein [Deinococcus navajonensis]|uniref:Uncharacterized protein n=1 Tax=Deinococcus navajonensis TaxID=309884 RepID=A0ABV8XT07_9DEIO
MGDTDAAGAKRDMLALANPGYTIQFAGSDRAQALAKREIDALETRLGDFRSWDEFINHQLSEAYEAGAASVEAYPFPSRAGVAGIEIVPAEEITILRQGNDRLYRQVTYGADLDPRTYIYSAYGLRGRDPHGTPALVSALVELERKVRLIDGADKIMRLMADGAFLQLGVPKPTLQELGLTSESDPGYIEALTSWYASYVQIATQAREYGVMVTQDGVDAKAIPITGNVQGVSQLQDVNNLRLWSGLMTLPFMRGKNEGTTQALAEVVYPILLSHAGNLQLVVKPVIEFVMNLHLRLAGVAASVEIDFKEPPNPFLESHANATLAQAQADAAYIEVLGDEYVRQVAARLDLDPDKVLAWRETQPPSPPAAQSPPPPNPPAGGDQPSASSNPSSAPSTGSPGPLRNLA